MKRVIPLILLFIPVMLSLSACSMIQRITPDWHIPLPKLRLPSMSSASKMIPRMPWQDQEKVEDPQVAFNARGILGYGHTLRLEVYEGSRSSDRIFRDIARVDTRGLLPLGDVGTARVGGQDLPTAVESIATVFRLAGRSTRPITVHIISVENAPVISINGDVRKVGFIPYSKKMSVQQAVTAAAGRKPGSAARSVYIARAGQRHFFTSLESANAGWALRAGDIITLSPDL